MADQNTLFRNQVRKLEEIIDRAQDTSQILKDIVTHYDTEGDQEKRAFVAALAGSIATNKARS